MSLYGIFKIEDWNYIDQSILNSLTESEYDLMINQAEQHTYEKGEIIFREGEAPNGVYFIKQGKVKKYFNRGEGKESIIYIAGKGELIGYHSVFSEKNHSHSAATLEVSIVAFIPIEVFFKVKRGSVAFTDALLKALAHDFTVFINLTACKNDTAERRVAVMLILSREKSKAGLVSGSQVEINISRTDLANFVGLSKEHVIRVLAGFKKQDIIKTQGSSIWVTDLEQLVAISKSGH
ncbi:Crp/Fnr family transcriptional regulator [Pedobacter sp. MC2016-14]|uniref:Crp/Fnr family transcriptional regulator n=1 Tax=Pedobacter sp. MC2016-14 TaxID=2897327 RepID=UPI001E3B45E5|nr:Crp/Fnr family transcriptional regulator [Pedobacter sp. MC2016-14]MCD0488315.1 Crp/Fnr family transcriptional regulator [Pedobacter sp. MC2016-14]